MSLTAEHRPATRRRRFRHDDLIAGDLFSGFGGLTQGIQAAGFETIMAANHNRYKVEIHEANHPDVEHWIADLVDPESANYHSVRDLPAVDLLAAGVSCVNHTQANSQKAYSQRDMSLFDMDDPDFDARVTRSERDRATANCVLHYAAQHHPRMMLIECTTELQSWGPAIPGKPKIGDGSTYRWWLKQIANLGYRYRVLYLNSMFFDVPQSRDRGYWIFWDDKLSTPDLDHRPIAWCGRCDQIVEAVWTWRTGVPPTGSVRYGKQYDYRCPSCRGPVAPPATMSLHALDLTDLGTRIGDKPLKAFKDKVTGEITMSPLAPSTMARGERCRQRFAEFPAVLMPAKAIRGVERHPWQPMATQTSQQETAILSTGALIGAAGNTYEAPGSNCRSRGFDQPLWSQYRAYPLDRPLGTVVGSAITQGLLFGGWYKQNGSLGTETAPHPVTDPFGTLCSRDTTAVLTSEWVRALSELSLEDCYFRMMASHEIGRGCGFDVDFVDYKGAFIVWGSARDQVDGFGNAVSPQVGEWIGLRLRAVLAGSEAVA